MSPRSLCTYPCRRAAHCLLITRRLDVECRVSAQVTGCPPRLSMRSHDIPLGVFSLQGFLVSPSPRTLADVVFGNMPASSRQSRDRLSARSVVARVKVWTTGSARDGYACNQRAAPEPDAQTGTVFVQGHSRVSLSTRSRLVGFCFPEALLVAAKDILPEGIRQDIGNT